MCYPHYPHPPTIGISVMLFKKCTYVLIMRYVRNINLIGINAYYLKGNEMMVRMSYGMLVEYVKLFNVLGMIFNVIFNMLVIQKGYLRYEIYMLIMTYVKII